MKRTVLVATLATTVLMGCTTVPFKEISLAEKQVRILRASDPPLECSEIGSIYATKYFGHTTAMVEDQLRREAVRAGGNVIGNIRRDLFSSGVTATVYFCPFKYLDPDSPGTNKK